MSQPSVILLGLPWDHPIVPSDKREHLRKTLAGVDTSMKEAGYEYRFVGVTPEAGVGPLIEELKSNPVDGICIGFGVRGFPESTPFFEKIIAAIREHAPKSKLFFNTSPDSTVDAAKRWLP